MKCTLVIVLLWCSLTTTLGQQKNEDSLRTVIHRHNGDKAEVDALCYLGFQQQQLDTAFEYGQQGLSLAKRISYKKGEGDCYMVFQRVFSEQGNFSEAIKYTLHALHIYEDLKDHVGMASAHGMLQAFYRAIGDNDKSLAHAFLSLRISEKHKVYGSIIFAGQKWAPLMLAEIAQTYLLMNQPDSAMLYTKKAIAYDEHFNKASWNFPVYLLGTIQSMKENYKSALENYHSAIPLAKENGFFHDTLQIFSGMSTLFKKSGQLDSAIYYAQMVALSTNPQLEIKNLLEAVNNLMEIYKSIGNKDSAFKYTELNHHLKDSLFSNEKDREIQNITFSEKLKQQEILSAQARYKSKVQLYALVIGLFILVLISSILWRNNLQKQKAKTKIEHAYNQLKSTQAQLIQSEKMASLGELTAGIAHEIQNPLNFVNNFSEVNKELLIEMKDEMKKGNIDEATSIANSLIDNQEKVNHHGKRADAIVKSMLQHSRANEGHKEPTNINAFADEYLRLSFQGFRAKDKMFNCDVQTNFAQSIGNIHVVPQDLGRVLLNIYNNAFYAVNEKAKLSGSGYQPTVAVSTSYSLSFGEGRSEVLIKVKDNGNGIPQNIIDKIFQPFFTTKPTGQGTGLGLSLAYDIIKAHGGELRVGTKAGEGAEFIIQLPLT